MGEGGSDMGDRYPKKEIEYDDAKECKRQIKDRFPTEARESCILHIEKVVDQQNSQFPTNCQTTQRTPSGNGQILSPLGDVIARSHQEATLLSRNGLGWVETAHCNNDVKRSFLFSTNRIPVSDTRKFATGVS